VRTWSIPSDISEAKQFAIAIYNITIIGGIGYFLGTFLEAGDANLGDLLRCIGVVMSATCAVLVIMIPKLLTVPRIHLFVFNEVYKAHKMLEDDSETGKKSSDLASSVNSQVLLSVHEKPRSAVSSGMYSVSEDQVSSSSSKEGTIYPIELANMQAAPLESIDELANADSKS
jgi:hypothetical protein